MKILNPCRSGEAFIIVIVGLFPIWNICAQEKQKVIECIPGKLPSKLILRETKPVRYKIITDYFNQDVFGNFFNKSRVMGEYTRGLADGKAKWNNMRIATANKKDDAFPEGARQDYMENFGYNPSSNFTDSSFFKGFPAADMYSRTLIWDMFTFENFAWSYFDSLQLNLPYHPGMLNTTVSLAGSGSFTNNDIKLTWTGISSMNGKKCVLIQFEALENPVNIKTTTMNARGRSHYWGNIWVALDDKQLEGAWMNEDVMMEIDFSGVNKQIINTIRKLTVEKFKD